MVDKPKRIGDMQPTQIPCDEKVDIDALLDIDVKLLDCQKLSGQFGDFLWIVVEDLKTNCKLGFSTGAKVVIRKISEAKEKGMLPILAKIVKSGRYYDIM